MMANEYLEKFATKVLQGELRFHYRIHIWKHSDNLPHGINFNKELDRTIHNNELKNYGVIDVFSTSACKLILEVTQLLEVDATCAKWFELYTGVWTQDQVIPTSVCPWFHF